MKKYLMTIGLFDKETEKQEIETDAARDIIAYLLIDEFNIFAFTMFDCYGVYKMTSTGAIIREPSIRVEIATDDELETGAIIEQIKKALNQESVMLETEVKNIEFI